MSNSETTKRSIFLGSFIRELMPWRLRRLVFLSSLYARVVDRKDFDQHHIKRLNRVLNLSNGLMLPNSKFLVRSALWICRTAKEFQIKDKTLKISDLGREGLDAKTEAEMITRIIDSIPCFLRYAKIPQTTYDAKKLLSELRTMGVIPVNA